MIEVGPYIGKYIPFPSIGHTTRPLILRSHGWELNPAHFKDQQAVAGSTNCCGYDITRMYIVMVSKQARERRK